MSESNPEQKGRPDPGEKRPTRDRTQTARDLGRTAVKGANNK